MNQNAGPSQGPSPDDRARYGQGPHAYAPPHGQRQTGPTSGWGPYATTRSGSPARLASPVPTSPAPTSPVPTSPVPTSPARTSPAPTSSLFTSTRVLLGTAAAAALAHGVFAIFWLRDVYSAFDTGDATLGEVDDRLAVHNVAVWVVIAVPASAAAGFGLIRMTGTDSAVTAAASALIVGVGFVVVAVGLTLRLATRGPAAWVTLPGSSSRAEHGHGRYGQSPPGYSQPARHCGAEPRVRQPGQRPYGQ